MTSKTTLSYFTLFYLPMTQILFFSANDWNQLALELNCELGKLSNWFKVNKLSLNVNKTNFVMFGKKLIKMHHFRY